ncbi:IS200/IS605 family transposase [Paenibacillus agricola]|uniref:IS200/IS605 family transposase n=1 Tax=Paenibacillus agricola TaxID=2716264 RepID=A0ABX0JEC4_9BACL|nr:IS200/IS605 family transposase [Paenibacillus agricola]NHN34880.1 IS200/IS605 family transposase [Paenibacillus agricola]
MKHPKKIFKPISIKVNHNNQYRVVFCTFRNLPIFKGQIAEDVKKWIYEIIEEYGGKIIDWGIEPHLVRMIIRTNPAYEIHQLIKTIKTITAEKIREVSKVEIPTLENHSPWTNAYYVRSLGFSDENEERSFIEDQKKK